MASVEENLQVLLRRPQRPEQGVRALPDPRRAAQQVAGLLSGGEQQMLALAPSLVAAARGVFVADEPTLGLAPLAAEVVFDALDDLRELGTALLLVEEKAREVLDVRRHRRDHGARARRLDRPAAKPPTPTASRRRTSACRSDYFGARESDDPSGAS